MTSARKDTLCRLALIAVLMLVVWAGRDVLPRIVWPEFYSNELITLPE